MSDATMATIKEGKLLKRSPQSTLFGGKKMQERFFILRADALLYYLPSDAEGIAAGRTGEASSRCKGMIPIEDVIGVYRAFELPTDSKDMQKMARSLLPSVAPATIFIPPEATSGHQMPSAAFHETQRPSKALLSRHQRSSEAIKGASFMPSKVINGHQRLSKVIKGHQRSSEAIKGASFTPSKAIRGHQRRFIHAAGDAPT